MSLQSSEGILVTDITYHYPVFHIKRQITTMVSEIYIERRLYNLRNKQAFLGEKQQIDWEEIYSPLGNPSCFDMFYGKLVTLLNRYFPKDRMKMKYNNKKPWLSDALRNSIKLKNKLYYKFRKVNSVYNNENTYKSYKQYSKRLWWLLRNSIIIRLVPLPAAIPSSDCIVDQTGVQCYIIMGR